MASPDNKRKLSSAGEEVRQQYLSKRLKSVDELGTSWRYIDSVDDCSLPSYSRSASLEMKSISRSTSIDMNSSDSCASLVSMKSSNLEENDSDTVDTPATIVPESGIENEDLIFQFPDTLEMASQPEMFDESQCYADDGASTGFTPRCRVLRQISGTILSEDEQVPQELHQETDVCDTISYVSKVPLDTKAEIAQYLSSGCVTHAQLTMENIHHFYHVASLLRLKQLRDHCLKFCHSSNQSEVISKFEGCQCHEEIKTESKTGYQRSQSVVSNPDDSDPPQYYVVFVEAHAHENKDKGKVKVLVIDTSQKRNVYQHEVEKLRCFGNGFACCSFEVKGAPFIMVSGGEGKSSNLVMKYDIILGRWDKCAKLHHGRSNHMMVTVGSNRVFALGGSEVSCIEEYCFKTNKWIERASLVTPVVSAVCSVFQNKIYIFGGKTPAGAVTTAQCYDINTHLIDRLPDLPCSFEGGQAVVLNDRIYIATDHRHMIRFKPETGYSNLCTQQPIERRQFGMFVKHDRIYVVGGVLCDNKEETKHIPQYRYNAEKDLWVEKRKLCHSFAVVASCIINYEKKCCVIPFNETF